jgi:hypothetical protein
MFVDFFLVRFSMPLGFFNGIRWRDLNRMFFWLQPLFFSTHALLSIFYFLILYLSLVILKKKSLSKLSMQRLRNFSLT